MQDLTIVIASKNQSKWFKNTIESLKKQTFQNFKVIVVDAYSNDDTDKLISNYDKIQVIKSDTKAEPAMFHGLNLVETKYVAIMCTSDFYYGEKWFEIAINELEKNKNISCVWSNAININEAGDFTGVWKPAYFLEPPPAGKSYLAFWFCNFYMPELNMVVNTSVLKDCIDLKNYKKENPNYLYQFYFNFTKNGYLQKYINYFGHAGRNHSNSLTTIDKKFETKNKKWIRTEQLKFLIKLILGLKNHIFIDSNKQAVGKLTILSRILLLYNILITFCTRILKPRIFF